MIGMPRGLTRATISSSRTSAEFLFAEQHDHRHRLAQRRCRGRATGIDLDDMAADHAHRLVVGEALVLRDDDAVDHAVGERQAQHLDRIVAGDAGRGAECHRGGAAAGHDAPFGAGQLGEALSRRFHQLVQVDELARCGVHRRTHLRQHQAAAVHRAHAAAIDERPHAEREIGIGVALGPLSHGKRSPLLSGIRRFRSRSEVAARHAPVVHSAAREPVDLVLCHGNLRSSPLYTRMLFGHAIMLGIGLSNKSYQPHFSCNPTGNHRSKGEGRSGAARHRRKLAGKIPVECPAELPPHT